MRPIAVCHPEKLNYGHGLCSNCYTRKWRTEHPDWVKARDRRRYQKFLASGKPSWAHLHPIRIRELTKRRHLAKLYGISMEEYDRWLEAQNGRCAICEAEPSRRMLAVDHDHETGKIRGLLCTRCNVAIGGLNDNPALLRKAIVYLVGVPP
ncbi:MAG TPA: hypothetical protein DCP69_11645 [Candidatus Omnitrophica bacterium]|nr:hypothetical protein [Candidatus Omnitrophota bacterium]